jgi:hypothetical protein
MQVVVRIKQAAALRPINRITPTCGLTAGEHYTRAVMKNDTECRSDEVGPGVVHGSQDADYTYVVMPMRL